MVWVLDYLLAFAFGVVFQYLTIAPMRGLGLGQGLWQAVTADAVIERVAARHGRLHGGGLFRHFSRRDRSMRLETASFEFWFMMQIAMLCGFATSYPVTWWLIRSGIKEPM